MHGPSLKGSHICQGSQSQRVVRPSASLNQWQRLVNWGCSLIGVLYICSFCMFRWWQTWECSGVRYQPRRHFRRHSKSRGLRHGKAWHRRGASPCRSTGWKRSPSTLCTCSIRGWFDADENGIVMQLLVVFCCLLIHRHFNQRLCYAVIKFLRRYCLSYNTITHQT